MFGGFEGLFQVEKKCEADLAILLNQLVHINTVTLCFVLFSR